MKNNKKSIIIALIVLIIIGILFAFFTIYKINSNNFTKEKYKLGIQTEDNTVLNEETINEMVEQEANKYIENTAIEEKTQYDYNSLEKEDTSTELFNEYYAKAIEILKTMSLEEKVGQLFLARYPEENVNKEIRENFPGGYILFGKDFKNETVETINKKIRDNQNNSKIKLILGVDEEGGEVVRVSAYKQYKDSKFKSPQELDLEGGIDKIIEDSHEKTSLLKSLGLNLNLVPVSDVSTNTDSFIFKRTYGKNAEETAIYSKSIVKAMNEDKMVSAMKHFPGYGDNVDTHTEVAIDERDLSQFVESDLKPFKAGIVEGVPIILVNHNIVKCMDNDLPSSLSKSVHEYLRKELNFSGIILTDDLAMDAVKEYVDKGKAAVQAIIAGNDMIISSDFVRQKGEVLEAVKNNTISEDTINRAARRILACKLAYGII